MRPCSSRCCFLGGILGRLFREFAVTICVAILISGIVSVTLTPMLCSRFLRSPEEQKRSWFYRITERFFEALLRVYDYTLQIVLRHRAATMTASLLVLAGTVFMFIQIPKGFIPDQDTDQIHAVTEAAQGTSYYQMVDYQKQVAEVFRTNPDVQALMSTVGGTSASTLGGPNYGELVVHLKPRSQRKLLVNDIIADLRPQAGKFPGNARLFAEPSHYPDRRPGHQELVPVLHAVA